MKSRLHNIAGTQFGILVFLTASLAVAGGVGVDGHLPGYDKALPGVEGRIQSVGSDTMARLMALWGEGFSKLYPDVQLEIESKGSSTAPPALMAGLCTFGPMSRKMTDKELDAFVCRLGYGPKALATSIDMLAIYVHKDNPIKGLTLQQVDAIFSKHRKGGYPRDITTWGDLGLGGAWARKPILLYGRGSGSGTHDTFKAHALRGGDAKDTVKEQSDGSSVVRRVAGNKFAIGYGGIGHKTTQVRAVPLAESPDAPTIPATPDNAYSGDYPLARFLFLYVRHERGSTLDPLRREFLRYVFSKPGQRAVIASGYFPVSAAVAKAQLASVGIVSDPR